MFKFTSQQTGGHLLFQCRNNCTQCTESGRNRKVKRDPAIDFFPADPQQVILPVQPVATFAAALHSTAGTTSKFHIVVAGSVKVVLARIYYLLTTAVGGKLAHLLF